MKIGTAIAFVGFAGCATAVAIFAPPAAFGALCGTVAVCTFLWVLTQ